MRRQVRLPISFGGINLHPMEDCAPFVFLRCWALVILYFCFRFHIFNKLGLEEYVSQVEGGPHLLQSCLHAAQDGLLLIAREMHRFF